MSIAHLLEYWFVVVILVCITVVGGTALYAFLRRPREEQLIKVKEWLLLAVSTAEKTYGSNMGQVKLRYCYDAFLTKFPYVAQVISFEMFSMLVDEALERMKVMLQSNKEMQTFVNGVKVGE